MPPGRRWHPGAWPAGVRDSVFIAVIAALSASRYVTALGFYSDDWWFLGGFGATTHPTLPWLFRSFYSPEVLMRPGQALYLSTLYWLFGRDPLGYHLVNTAMLAAGAILFHLVLRELQRPRAVALAVALVYLLLPHYATVRFWYAAFQITLSMTTYFLSLYADLRALSVPPRARLAWKVLAITALLASTLSYEIFLPFFALNPVIAWYRTRQLAGASPALAIPRPLALAAPTLLTLAAVCAFKAAVTSRIEPATFEQHVRWFTWFLAAVIHTGATGPYGIALPMLVRQIMREYADPTALVASIATALAIGWYLARVATESHRQESHRQWITRRDGLILVACGIVTFPLGYSIFLTNFNADLSPTGIVNRTAMAASTGVALVLVGGIGLASTLPRAGRWRVGVFAALGSLICAVGVLVVNTLSLFWITAAQRQQAVLDALGRHLPSVTRGGVVMLDGVCPYVGPAPVFETSWDFTGALRLTYGDQSLRGDVITPTTEVRTDGLYTRIYHFTEGPYRYRDLVIFNAQRMTTYTVPDARAADAYFRAFNPDRSSGCPWSTAGTGEPVFEPRD